MTCSTLVNIQTHRQTFSPAYKNRSYHGNTDPDNIPTKHILHTRSHKNNTHWENYTGLQNMRKINRKMYIKAAFVIGLTFPAYSTPTLPCTTFCLQLTEDKQHFTNTMNIEIRDKNVIEIP